MAKKSKQTAASSTDEVKKLAAAKKVVIGTERVMKMLRAGKISRVFVTSNCPKEVRENLERYASISKADVVQLDIPNDELGVVCKKQFSISIVGVSKE